MAVLHIFLVFCCLQLQALFTCSATLDTLKLGQSLSVEKTTDVLVSKNGVFTAGFFPVGDNAFCFAIWINKSTHPTVVWMANRDKPVNGRRSKFSLLENGNLVLLDAIGSPIWSVGNLASPVVQLQLLNSGNLVLQNSDSANILWQSFGCPTDTLLPEQQLTRNTTLISSRTQTDRSSSHYKLYFDEDNVLRLLFHTSERSSQYWPIPSMSIWDAGRSVSNSSRVAVFDSFGHFISSDNLTFNSIDFGANRLRRLTLDPDGNLRLYSLDLEDGGSWVVSWQAIANPCKIHGICGPNSICNYDHALGRSCSCLPEYEFKNLTDWVSGCQPKFDPSSCEQNIESKFFKLDNVEFCAFDSRHLTNVTFKECEMECLKLCCRGFQITFNKDTGHFDCFCKISLLNGYQTPIVAGDFYLKLPKNATAIYNSIPHKVGRLNCSNETFSQPRTTYTKFTLLLRFATALGGAETIFIFLGCCLMVVADRDYNRVATRGNDLSARFKRFTYAEMKRATQSFSTEVGRGGGGIVYKGKLSDERIAAIKNLNEANQGEEEFLAEVMTIGKINHMNLIQMWGHCAQGKHRLLVYEFMENGSLADNLTSHTLNWEKRLEIAIGTAKGLSYLHEQCCEWIFHCDIKPQNILLDANYHPKVADFGLSKLLNRGGLNNSGFSRIRGTRGYMAPEWIYNLPITSKVDVYSYGIVVLEMVTGKSPTGNQACQSGELTEHTKLVTWVKEKITRDCWLEEILDPVMRSDYDKVKMENLVKVALQCSDQDPVVRPTMKQVMQMLHAS